MKTINAIAVVLLLQAGAAAEASTNMLEYGDEDLCNTGTYSSDPKAGATLGGLAPDTVTYAGQSFGHGYPFSPETNDYPGTDRIFVGSVMTTGHDGYAAFAGRTNGPQVVTLDYSSLVPAGQTIVTLTLGVGADDFQAPYWGNPFTVKVNGTTNAALTDAINALNQTGPYEQFLTIGIDPASLENDGVLTLSVDEGGDGGDGWAIDFLTVAVTTSSNAATLGALGVGLTSHVGGSNTVNIALPAGTLGDVLDMTTNLAPPVLWTSVWTNSGQTTVSFPAVDGAQFFRLRR